MNKVLETSRTATKRTYKALDLPPSEGVTMAVSASLIQANVTLPSGATVQKPFLKLVYDYEPTFRVSDGGVLLYEGYIKSSRTLTLPYTDALTENTLKNMMHTNPYNFLHVVDVVADTWTGPWDALLQAVPYIPGAID
jgi:hypothetical protein